MKRLLTLYNIINFGMDTKGNEILLADNNTEYHKQMTPMMNPAKKRMLVESDYWLWDTDSNVATVLHKDEKCKEKAKIPLYDGMAGWSVQNCVAATLFHKDGCRSDVFTYYDVHVIHAERLSNMGACFCCTKKGKDPLQMEDFTPWEYTDLINRFSVYQISCDNPGKYEIYSTDGNSCLQCDLAKVADPDHKKCIDDPVLEDP